MEKVYKYYKIAASEDSYRVGILCHKITATKFQDLSYGVVVIIIVSERKPMKNI